MSELRTTPVRLDNALEDLAAQAVGPAMRQQVERFDAVLKARERLRQSFAPPSLVDEIFEFVMPMIGNPHVLRAEHFVALLEDLVTALDAAAVEASDEMSRVGAAVIREELRKQQMLREQLNGLIDA